MLTFSRVLPIKSLAMLAMAGAMLMGSGVSVAQQVLHLSAAPDETPAELQHKFKPLGNYLEQKLGVKVEFIPVTDYAASAEGLIENKLDMAWLDGFAFVQANVRSKGQVMPIVQREEDEKSRSIFITTAKTISNPIDLKKKNFMFGPKSSTSGHLMPLSALLAAKINPAVDMKTTYSSSHEATVAAVTAGKADAGALGLSAWQNMISEGKINPRKVRVFYTTQPYSDYNWSVRADMNPVLRKKLTDAFLALNKNDPQGKEILDLQHATRFIPTNAGNYAPIEAAARNAGWLK